MKGCATQAVVNEDTSGDAALLRVEVQRLKEELASYKNDNLLHKAGDLSCILHCPL